MNWDEIEGNWKQIKGKVRSRWGKLTDDDVEVIKGRRTELLGLLQKRYGHARKQAERFIQTALREWLYARPYSQSAERAADMPAWLRWCNHHTPHSALKAKPAFRLNNVLGNDN